MNLVTLGLLGFGPFKHLKPSGNSPPPPWWVVLLAIGIVVGLIVVRYISGPARPFWDR